MTAHGIRRPADRPLTYSERLDADLSWAMAEGGRHLRGEGTVHETLKRLCDRLRSLGIPHAVVGGMAMFQHGYRRFTEDVDVLVTREGLKSIHAHLTGRGYRPPFEKSKNLKDTETGVKIEFLLTGDYPGDGKPKPVSFPDPAEVSEEIGGISVIGLPKLIELKLASGTSAPGRAKDLGDVTEMIKVLNLPRGLADKIDPSVRANYLDHWEKSRRRFTMLWRNKGLTSEAKAVGDMVRMLRAAAEELERMEADGVQIKPDSVQDDCAWLVTDDPQIATKYDMHDESEYLEEDTED